MMPLCLIEIFVSNRGATVGPSLKEDLVALLCFSVMAKL